MRRCESTEKVPLGSPVSSSARRERQMASVGAAAELGGWDPAARRYRCCCGCTSAKSGTLLMGLYELVLLLPKVFSLLAVLRRLGGSETAEPVLGALVTVVELLCLLCVFWGLWSERAALLVPHLVYKIIVLALTLMLGVLTLVVMAVAAAHGLPPDLQQLWDQASGQTGPMGPGVVVGVVMGFVLVFGLLTAVQAWFLDVHFRCYGFLTDKAAHRRMAYLMGPEVVQDHARPIAQPYYPLL